MIPSHLSRVIAGHIATLLSFFVITACLFAADAAPEKHTIDVPADTVENAIKKLFQQTGVHILVPTNVVRGIRSKPVKGEYTAREALEIMLNDTGLVVEQSAKSNILTVRMGKAAPDTKKNEPRADASGGNASGDAEPRAQTASVTGHVFNAATGYYVKNAEVRLDGTDTIVFTEDGGAYSITVPAGAVSLTASYAGAQSSTVAMDAIPGARNTAEFDLQPLVIERPAPLVPATGAVPVEKDVIVMDRFVVAEERAGQAKAIQTQRAAENAVIAIATDNFGELTQGSIGEFLKYMPGVSLEYLEDEANTVRVGGLDGKYTGFSLDGIALASSHEQGSRGNFLEQMSITGIESIEFNQTLLARMPANTPAGKFELKSKYAFDRKRPEFRYTLGLDGISEAIELGRSYMPDDKKHYRTYPGGQIGWGGPFFNRRLGVDISLSRFASYRNNQSHRVNYSYLDPDPEKNPGITFVERNGNPEMKEGPVIRQLTWRDSPQIRTYYAANLSLDYRITPNLTFSLRSQFSYTEREYFHIYVNMTAEERTSTSENYGGPHQGIHPGSTLTKWIVDPITPNSINTCIDQDNSYRVNQTTNYLISPRLEYKNGPIQVNFRGGRSYSRAAYKDSEEGRFRGSVNRITGIGWEATRPNADSPTWTLKQTNGTDWTQPDNWNRTQTTGFGIYYNDPHFSKNIQDSACLDLTLALPVLGHPVTLRAGGGTLKSEYAYRQSGNRFNFTGPESRQIGSTIPYTQNYIFNMELGGKAGNINDQGWRVDDQKTLWNLYQQNPAWFVADDVNNFRRSFINARDLDERIDAAYIEATTRAGRFSFNAGLRFENTTVEVLTTRMRPWEDIDAARKYAGEHNPELVATGIFDYTTNADGISEMTTNEGFLYRYYDGRRFPRTTRYDNLFFSGGIKYDFSKNLRFQLSASQAILRPDYSNLAGNMQYSSYYAASVWVPNPTLKPEKTTKIYAGIQWYLKHAGILSLSGYRLDIDGLQIANIQITPAQAEAQLGYPLREAIIIGDEDEGGLVEIGNNTDVYYRSTINATGTRTIYGATLEYNQQLAFLPGAFKGLSVFGSFTLSSLGNAQIEEEKIGRPDRTANGGIRYRYGRFNIQLRATWQDDSLHSVTRPLPNRIWFNNDHLYQKARTIVDLSGGFRLLKNMELSFSVRNLTDAPSILYSNAPGRLHRYQIYGSTWNLSLKGTF